MRAKYLEIRRFAFAPGSSNFEASTYADELAASELGTATDACSEGRQVKGIGSGTTCVSFGARSGE